jgi:WD40 repeat protein
MATINSSSTAQDAPLPTANEIAAALQSLPGLFFHRIASRLIEVGMDGKQLMDLVYSVQPAPLLESFIHANNVINKREQHVEDEREISPAVAGAMVNHASPSKKQKILRGRDVSIPSSTQASAILPTPEEIAEVLQLGRGEYFQQLAFRILEMGIGGKQLRNFVFSVVPHIPVNVVLRQMLPLLDRVSWNRVCIMNKEIHDASRGVVPPWPYKRLQTGYIARSLVFSPDGGLLACACANGVLRIWDRIDGRCTRLEGHTGDISCLSFSPNGGLLASAGEDRSVRLWTLADNSRRILEGHVEYLTSVVFAPNGLSLASGSYDGSTRIWDVIDGRCTKVLRDERMDFVVSVAFSPDGATLASGGVIMIIDDDEDEDESEEDASFGVILLWDLLDEDDGGTLLFQSQEGNSDILSIAYSPNGKFLAAAGGVDLKVRLWNIADRTLQTVFEGHSDRICSVCFSPNGKILASAGGDRSVQLWDVDAGDSRPSCLANLSGHHNGMVNSVAFSPDGRTLASGSLDGTVRLWNPFEDSTLDKNADWKGVFHI